MTKPNRYVFDAVNGQSIEREMTEEEYAELIATGWTPGETQEETVEE